MIETSAPEVEGTRAVDCIGISTFAAAFLKKNYE
jgi:hypothetical protein